MKGKSLVMQESLKNKRSRLNSEQTIDNLELFRLEQLHLYENEGRKRGFKIIAGVDEAGRGPLAGPVVAAACAIPKGILFEGLNDSKQLTPKKRAALFEKISSCADVNFSIATIDHLMIDKVNIYQATILAMLQAIAALDPAPDYLLVDGLKLPHPSIPCEAIIKGDAKSHSIAAASVLAKETRDKMMLEYHEQWPHYGFDRHKGYGTAAHLEAIRKHGPCPIHRKTFEPIKSLR